MASEPAPATDAKKHNGAVPSPHFSGHVVKRCDMASEPPPITAVEKHGAAVSSPQVSSDNKAKPGWELTGLSWFIVNIAVLSATFFLRARQHCDDDCAAKHD